MSEMDSVEQKLDAITRELRLQRKLLIFLSIGMAVLLLPLAIGVIGAIALSKYEGVGYLFLVPVVLLLVFLVGAYVVSKIAPSADVLPKNAEREG